MKHPHFLRIAAPHTYNKWRRFNFEVMDIGEVDERFQSIELFQPNNWKIFRSDTTKLLFAVCQAPGHFILDVNMWNHNDLAGPKHKVVYNPLNSNILSLRVHMCPQPSSVLTGSLSHVSQASLIAWTDEVQSVPMHACFVDKPETNLCLQTCSTYWFCVNSSCSSRQ